MNRRLFAKLAALLPFTIPTLVKGVQCCPRDHNHDGNCDIHSAPGVKRKRWIMISVKDAQRLGVCRLCGEKMSAVFILNYGAEYAHQKCLKATGIKPNQGVPVRMD